jgi:hypothetical protein
MLQIHGEGRKSFYRLMVVAATFVYDSAQFDATRIQDPEGVKTSLNEPLWTDWPLSVVPPLLGTAQCNPHVRAKKRPSLKSIGFEVDQAVKPVDTRFRRY